MDFYELDPFGEQRADVRHAHMMAHLARVNGDKIATPERFMPFPIHDEKEARPVKAEVAKERLQALFGGSKRGAKHC